MRHLALAAIFATCVQAGAQQGCSQFNQVLPQLNGAHTDTTGHMPNSGYHGYGYVGDAACNYLGAAGQACTPVCQAGETADTSENGTLTNPLLQHVPGYAQTSGNATGTAGSTVTCGAVVAVSVASCFKILPCNVSVSISASPAGIGTGVSYSPNSVWNNSQQYTGTCGAHTLWPGGGNGYVCTPNGPPPGKLETCNPYWDTATCSWECDGGDGI